MMETPVVMISYNRPDLVRRTMRNVALAEAVENRDITMYIDGPRNETDKIKQDEIERIVSGYRKQLPRLKIVRREKNFGCRGNIVDAITTVISEYGRAIVVEDDILVSRTFFRYMDAALDQYEGDSRIWCINAWRSRYVQIPPDYLYDVYLTRRNMCWGWGTWKDRWLKVDFDLKDWPEFRRNFDFMSLLAKVGIELPRLVEAQYAGRLRTWDVQCSYHMAKFGLLAVEPRFPLTKNIGFSSDCEHCSRANVAISHAPYYNFVPSFPSGIGICPALMDRLSYANVDPRINVRICRKLQRILWSLQGRNDEPRNRG